MIHELDWLKKWSQYSPHANALIDGDTQKEYSYEDVYHQACAGAHFLQNKYDVKYGDRVLLYSTNEVSSLILFFSCIRLGATLVPINYRLAPREISYLNQKFLFPTRTGLI